MNFQAYSPPPAPQHAGAVRLAQVASGGLALVRRSPPVPTRVYDTLWRFAAGRQAIYHARLRGLPAPWTADPILQQYRFTNCYRVSDRVSQYLVGHVQGRGGQDPANLILRTLLYKIFNRIETWELIERAAGEVTAASFDVGQLDQVLANARAAGASIYSAAYIMPSGPPELRATSKHRMHLEFLARCLADGTFARLARQRSLRSLYHELVALPGLGNFLAYQYAIDLNYTGLFRFDESEFVVPGPGARDGLSKCFASLGDYTETEAIQWMRERSQEEFRRLDLQFEDLFGRPLQAIDAQNLCCEISKYSRAAHPEVRGVAGREKIKQQYHPSERPLPAPVFPAWWGLRVPQGLGAAAVPGSQQQLV